jgi:hypothetical protein
MKRHAREWVVPIPRHTDLDDRFGEAVFKECEPELGERWWRKK